MAAKGKSKTKQVTGVFTVVVALTLLVGIGLDIELTRLHYSLHNDASHVSYCGISETINCDKVELSEYAMLFRVPVSVWGGLFHLLALALFSFGLLRNSERGAPFGILFGMSLFSVGFSIYLAAISFFVIGALCLLCLGLYVVAIVLFLSTFMALKSVDERPFERAIAELKTLFSETTGFAVGLVGVTILLSATLLYAYPRWYRLITDAPEQQNLVKNLFRGVEDGHPYITPVDPKSGLKTLDVIEYSDYECPFCRIGHLQLRAFLLETNLPIRFFHRHYPLGKSCNPKMRREMHKHACHAAKASICAMAQKRFWQFNDYMFTNQKLLAPGQIEILMQKAGLDLDKLKTCLESEKTTKLLKDDVDFANKIKILGTPTYLLVGLTQDQCAKFPKFRTKYINDKYCMFQGIVNGELLVRINGLVKLPTLKRQSTKQKK